VASISRIGDSNLGPADRREWNEPVRLPRRSGQGNGATLVKRTKSCAWSVETEDWTGARTQLVATLHARSEQQKGWNQLAFAGIELGISPQIAKEPTSWSMEKEVDVYKVENKGSFI
jgi:hypothetical protein